MSDEQQPYACVVYRVDAHCLEGLQEELNHHDLGEGMYVRKVFDTRRRVAHQCGEDFDAAEVMRSLQHSERFRQGPWQTLIKIKGVFLKEEHAEEEVRRLNLIAAPGCRYFWNATDFYPNGRKAQKDEEKENA